MFSWFKSRGLPPVSGSYKVGCADYLSVDSDSTIIRIYYPTESSVMKEDFPLVHWLPSKEYASALINSGRGFFASVLGGILHWQAGKANIPAYWQAPLLKQKNIHETTFNFPCIVFSHGMMGNRCVYSTFCCELASKGCVVAALEHRDKSASITYTLKYEGPNLVKEWIPQHNLQTDEDEYELRNDQVNQRSKECIKALNFLDELNNGICSQNLLDEKYDLQQFKGCLDLSKAAIVGHSFGSCSAILALSQEKRFKCGVAMDIWMYPISQMLNSLKVVQPVLLLSNKDWQWTKNDLQMKELQEKTLQDYISVMISGSDHLSQSDIPSVMLGGIVKALDAGSVDSHELLRINKTAMWAFISRKLGLRTNQENEPLLDGGSDLPSFVTIESQVDREDNTGVVYQSTL